MILLKKVSQTTFENNSKKLENAPLSKNRVFKFKIPTKNQNLFFNFFKCEFFMINNYGEIRNYLSYLFFMLLLISHVKLH